MGFNHSQIFFSYDFKSFFFWCMLIFSHGKICTMRYSVPVDFGKWAFYESVFWKGYSWKVCFWKFVFLWYRGPTFSCEGVKRAKTYFPQSFSLPHLPTLCEFIHVDNLFKTIILHFFQLLSDFFQPFLISFSNFFHFFYN